MGNRDHLEGADLIPDVLGRSFAERDLLIHVSSDLVDVVVHHRQGDAYRQHGNDGESDGRVGDEAVRLDPVLEIHCGTVQRTPCGMFLCTDFAF